MKNESIRDFTTENDISIFNNIKQFIIKDLIPLRLVDYIDKVLELHRKKLFEMFAYRMDIISMKLDDLNFMMTQVMNETIMEKIEFESENLYGNGVSLSNEEFNNYALENLKLNKSSRKSEKEARNMAITEEKIWLSLTKSGKGISIKVGDDFYVGNIETLKKFINGKIKGVPLKAEISGVLRGLVYPQTWVTKGMKVGDIDPR